ncbi:FG-GAP-like repeat-containing protein [Candidatus Neomarinimicrobiota bacterium]
MKFIRNLAAGLLLIIITDVLFAGAVDTSWVQKMFTREEGDISIIPDFDDAYGVSFRDINNDGLPDLYVTRFRELNRLLINRGQGLSFKDQTIRTGLGGNLTPQRLQNLELGADIIDFNNDGLPDVLTVGWGVTTTLYKQQKILDFKDYTEDIGLKHPISGNAGIWADIDIDGDLDLFITDEHGKNHLYVQSKPEVFTELADGFGLDGHQISQGAAFGDLNADGYPDLYICNWFEPDMLFINKSGEYFEKAPILVTHLTDSLNSNGVTFGDLDNDGDLDILVTDRNNSSKIYRNDFDSTNNTLRFTDVTDNSLLINNYPSYSGNIADFNNDGLLDIFFTNIGPNLLFLNQGSIKFQLAYTEQIIDYEYPDANYSTGAAVADLENDGDLDLFVSNKDTYSQLYVNPLQNSNYLRFEFEGIYSNRDAIGTKVWLYEEADSASSNRLIGFREISSSAGYLSASELIAHFGVRSNITYTLRALFPSGREIILNNIIPDQTIKIDEVSGILKVSKRTQQTIGTIVRQPSFLINLGLILFLIILIGLFIAIAIKRYLWKSKQTAIFLVIILSILYIFWSGMRDRPMSETLGVQILVILTILIFTIGFMEKLRQVNKKRFEYRHVLHRFSEDLIFIRNNTKLYDQLVTMIQSSLDVKFTGVVEIKNEKTGKQYFSIPNNIKWNTITFSDEQIRVLLANNSINQTIITEQYQQFPPNIDLIIPLKRQAKLYAMLILIRNENTKFYQQEDITLLTTVANQASLAIENNLYIEETKALTKSLTESQVQKRYVNELEEKNRNLEELFIELRETQSQLIQSEKMSSLGQLVAGVAHELNNPIGYLYANMKELQKYINLLKQGEDGKIGTSVEYIKEDIDQLILESVEGSERVKTIVENLRKFSRLDEAEFKYADIHEGLDSTIMLIEKELGKNIKLHKDYSDMPSISCMPGHLNQVFLNMLLNAIQAIEGNGNIWISTAIKNDKVVIKFKDDGKGIPKENIVKIFEPFFTTKPVGMGTGLGLSISYGIIQEHGGDMKVKSKKKTGTTFTISIPYNPLQK